MNSTLHPTGPTSHLTDDQMVLVYYREPLEEAGLDGHVAECASCRDRFQALTRVLQVVGHDETPAPAADFEARMITQVLAAARRPERGRLLHFPKMARILAAGAALAASLLVAFSVGREAGREDEQAISAAQTQERILLTALGEHLGRSRVTLVELKNREITTADLKTLQAAAENLLNASRLFRAAAERAGEGQVASAMEETERLVIRFAAAPSEQAKNELDGLRKRVDARDLPFRLQVLQAQIEKREKSFSRPSQSSL